MSSRKFECGPREPEHFAPIFVVATPRSYSSVVTTMVGQHPELAGLPELKLFAYSTIGDLDASLPQYWRKRGATHRSPGLVRAVAQFEFGGQDLASLDRAQGWLRERSNWTGAHVLDFLLSLLKPRVAVEKSPENVECVAALRRLSLAYPRAKYLHLTRHPVSTQKSMQDHLHRMVPGFATLGEPMSGICGWLATQQRILNFAASLPSERYLRIKGEDVLNDPHSNLKKIAAWLGLRTDEETTVAMMRPQDSPFAFETPACSGVMGGHDPEFLRNPVPCPAQSPPALKPPAGWVGNLSLWQSAVELANQLGYE